MILNLTPYDVDDSHREAGVREPPAALRKAVRDLLAFDGVPDPDTVHWRARVLANHVCTSVRPRPEAAVIDGPSFLMAPLERELRKAGIRPVHSVVRKETEDAGPFFKTFTRYRHLGFVEGRG